MDKEQLNETEIRTKFITPAIMGSGWDVMKQISEEKYFTDGKIFVRGKMVARGKGKKADYLLYYEPNILLAVVEAKDNSHEIDGGLQQALGYAEILDAPFVFSSNGDGFAFHDRTGTYPEKETTLALDSFPSPAELWQKYRQWKGLTPEAEKVTRESYYDDASGKEPRYYQRNAINRTVEAIAKGQDRILLVMATGTGKTFTAFQIIWRLWKSRTKKRILYLADRNILIDQTMVNDFRPFGEAMAKLSAKSKTINRDDGSGERIGGTIDRKHRRIDTSYEIYLGLYQSLTGPEDADKIYREFSRDFFDLIVIDECHRGSAVEDSAWREILEHFTSATHIGMTATPKETKYVSNIHYFGDPVYTYSLKQGIADGFLAPYKVIKVHIDKDVEGYRPERGKKDADGNPVEDRLYNQKDFDRHIVIDDRTKLVAKKVSEYIRESGDPYQKTIVFCVDTEHALRMRKAFVNENEKLVQENSRYVMRITGDDKEGVDQLDNFIDPESRYPVIVTTSRLLKDGGRCAIVLPDGTLFGEGVKTRLKEELLESCNLHTIVRLPDSVFKPYASIGTNLLFFEKGKPTEEIWYFQHQVVEGQKAYSKTRPIQFEHLQPCIDWWGGPKRKGREETEFAWRVTVDQVKERHYNLDFKNPHSEEADHGDPGEVLAALEEAEAEAAKVRDQLKGILEEALLKRERLNAASLHRIATAPDDNALRTAARFHFQILPRVTVQRDQIAPLRQTILDLAVRGKLTLQNHGESTSKERSSIPDGQKKPKWVGPIESDELPCSLPRHWEWIRLGEVAQIKHGYAFKSEYFTTDPQPYVLATPGNFHERGGFRDIAEKRKYYSGPVDPAFVLETGENGTGLRNRGARILLSLRAEGPVS